MYLGIDLGTSSVKAILIDQEQNIISEVTESLTISRPQPLWSEQNPEDWWQATEKVINKLKQNSAGELQNLKAIGLSGQMHGAILLDKKNRLLRPAILWNDGRSQQQCNLLLQREPEAINITGNLIAPGFTAPKIIWVKQHEPEIFKNLAKILLPKDYLRFRLSGDYATDMSDASGTSWLEVGKRRWSEKMLNACDLTGNFMPELYEGSDITGQISSTLATQWGIPSSVKIVAGGGDNAASAISLGVVEPGEAFLSLGTSGVYFVADNQYHPNPTSAMHTMCHCLANRWHEMTVMLSCANCLDWFGHILNEKIEPLLTALENKFEKNTPIFLPYLSGERTPYNNPHALGVFFGLTHQTQKSHMLQAILEGIAFAFADGQQAIQQAGINIQNVSVVGGGAKNKLWGKILASVLNKTLNYYDNAHVGGAFGAARLAWFAFHGGSPQQLFTKPKLKYQIHPDKDLNEIYSKKLHLYRKLYQQLKTSFEELH